MQANIITIFYGFYRTVFDRSVTQLPWVQMTPNLVCMFLAMTWMAVHKNRNSTSFHFLLFPLIDFIEAVLSFFEITPLWLILSAFLAKGITCCASFFQWDILQSWKHITLHWVFLEIFPKYEFSFHSQLKGYFIFKYCTNTLLITSKQTQ